MSNLTLTQILGAPNGWAREWSGVGARALALAEQLRAAHPKAIGPRVRLLQLMRFVSNHRLGLATTKVALAAPPELLRTIAIGLNGERHWKASEARSSKEPATVLAARLKWNEKTVRRARTSPSGELAEDENEKLQTSNRFKDTSRRRALYNRAEAEIETGTLDDPDFSKGHAEAAEAHLRAYCRSDNLLRAFAEMWGIVTAEGAVTQGAVEAVAGGLRDPEKFKAAGRIDSNNDLAGSVESFDFDNQGRLIGPRWTLSVNKVAKASAVDHRTIQSWRAMSKWATGMAGEQDGGRDGEAQRPEFKLKSEDVKKQERTERQLGEAYGLNGIYDRAFAQFNTSLRWDQALRPALRRLRRTNRIIERPS